jgi:ribosome-associated protein
MDDPMVIRGRTAIPLREITLRASRSSGPGGQHANVTASRVEARFDVEASQSLSAVQKARIVERLGPVVHAVAQDERSQIRNRELALERLRARLASALAVPRARRATRPSAASVARNQAGKQKRSQRKALRRPPSEET